MTEYTVVPKKFSDLHQRAKPHNARLLEALRENRERYRLLAQHISDVIWVADLDLNLLYYSPSIERLRGYTVEEALSHRFEEMVTPASLETARNLLAQVASLPESELRDPGLTRTVELEYLCKDGSTVWTEARVSFQHDQDGWPVALVGVTRDISERKQAEFERDATLDKLRKANALLDTLLQATPDVMYFKDAQGHNLIVNRAYEELVGLEKQDIIGKTDEQLLAPALAEQCQASDAQALQSRQTVRIEEQFTDDEGQTAFFDTLKVPILDDHGEVAGLVCISRDVTERVQMEKALQESEERLRLVVQNMPVMLDALDADNNFIVWNREAERVTGYRAEEIIGNPQALELLYPDAAYLQRALDEWTERGNAFRDRELQITHKDGAIKTVSWCNMSQQFPIPGWTAWAIGVDVTERVRAESQRDAMLKALQESEEQYRATIDAMGDSSRDRGRPHRHAAC
jgi:PAS domain S-box-containing protein